MNPPCLSPLSLSGGVEWQKERHWIDGWLPKTVSPLTSSSHTLTVRGLEGGGVTRGGGGGRRGEAGVIPGFRFHSAVVAGGGTGERRWGLWELCEG